MQNDFRTAFSRNNQAAAAASASTERAPLVELAPSALKLVAGGGSPNGSWDVPPPVVNVEGSPNGSW